MIRTILLIVALMVVAIMVATFGGLRMGERLLDDPANIATGTLSVILWTVLPILLVTIVGVVAIMMVFRRFLRGNRALLRSGISGTATVLSLRDTGTTVNRVNAVVELGLMVALPGRAPYQAKLETMIGRMNWGGVQPGMQLAVRVDPTDLSRITIDWGGAAASPLHAAMATPAAAMAGAAFMIPGTQDAFRVAAVRSAADIVAQGRPAEAVIQSMAHTGATVAQMAPAGAYTPDMADDPMVRITLRVEPSGGAPFTTDGLFRVPKAKLGQLTLGGRVPVAVISGDRASATIDWARL